MKLIWRKAKGSPVEQHRHRAGRSGVDAPKEEIAAGSQSMAQLGMQRKDIQTIARA